jgi:hypothetical protein
MNAIQSKVMTVYAGNDLWSNQTCVAVAHNFDVLSIFEPGTMSLEVSALLLWGVFLSAAPAVASMLMHPGNLPVLCQGASARANRPVGLQQPHSSCHHPSLRQAHVGWTCPPPVTDTASTLCACHVFMGVCCPRWCQTTFVW